MHRRTRGRRVHGGTAAFRGSGAARPGPGAGASGRVPRARLRPPSLGSAAWRGCGGAAAGGAGPRSLRAAAVPAAAPRVPWRSRRRRRRLRPPDPRGCRLRDKARGCPPRPPGECRPRIGRAPLLPFAARAPPPQIPLTPNTSAPNALPRFSPRAPSILAHSPNTPLPPSRTPLSAARAAVPAPRPAATHPPRTGEPEGWVRSCPLAPCAPETPRVRSLYPPDTPTEGRKTPPLPAAHCAPIPPHQSSPGTELPPLLGCSIRP